MASAGDPEKRRPDGPVAPGGRFAAADFAAEGSLTGVASRRRFVPPRGKNRWTEPIRFCQSALVFRGEIAPPWEETRNGRQESRQEVRQEDRTEAERRLHEGHAA